MSIDEGQFEAGRSLGLSYIQTFTLVILPQAVKNVLPALANEVIVLLKETSVSGYIGLMDLTKGGDIIIFGRNSHVGLVEGITGEYIITIEGNAGPTAVIGSGKPGAVVRNAYRIDSKKIKGIIRPD